MFSVVLILIYMSYKDIKTYEVPLHSQVLLAICSLIFSDLTVQSMESFSILFILFMVLLLLRNDMIGGADIKILLILSIVFKFQIYEIMLISSLTAGVYAVISKRRKIPFIPFITWGVLCQFLI